MFKYLRLFVCVGLWIILVSGCFTQVREDNEPVPSEPKQSSAQKLLNKMSLEEKLWQLFFVTPEAVSPGTKTALTPDFAEAAACRRVGGIILFAENIYSREQVRTLLSELSAGFEIPVFLGVDEEGGTVSRLGKKGIVADNGSMRAVGDSGDFSAAADVGRRLGSELSGLGFNLDFAPVADIITNSGNTEIGRRSFGSEPELVGGMVAAEVGAMQSCGVSAVLKHFPGHGSTSVNSHKGSSVSRRSLDELKNEDMKPFAAGIAAGADFVMISHMSLPKVTGGDLPCSLSPYIVTELLKNELAFGGVVITDALNMGAVSARFSSAEAAVRAIEAGADMLLMPQDLDEAFDALLEAVNDGRISEARIDESVSRILKIKEKRGLLK